jgi:hypothetical protein
LDGAPHHHKKNQPRQLSHAGADGIRRSKNYFFFLAAFFFVAFLAAFFAFLAAIVLS